MKLTPKQKAFADFYIELGNAAEAAIKAGYSKRTAKEVGYENLTKPHIKNYIEERMKQIESDRIAKAEEVLAFLSSSLRGDVLEEVVATESDGVGGVKPVILKKQLSAKDRIKAAELLGKRYTLFTDKLDANVKSTTIIFEGEDDLED